jgi:hypothetical protein
MVFQILDKQEKLFDSGHLAVYRFSNQENISHNITIDDFLTDNNYLIIDNSALGRPFEISQINHEYFKIFTKETLDEFLFDFAKPSGWSDNTSILNQIDYFKTFCVGGRKILFNHT